MSGESGMMANGVSGCDAWDLFVQGAMAADFVILPVGRATCLTRPERHAEVQSSQTASGQRPCS
jgi:hypothetical protein